MFDPICPNCGKGLVVKDTSPFNCGGVFLTANCQCGETYEVSGLCEDHAIKAFMKLVLTTDASIPRIQRDTHNKQWTCGYTGTNGNL